MEIQTSQVFQKSPSAARAAGAKKAGRKESVPDRPKSGVLAKRPSRPDFKVKINSEIERDEKEAKRIQYQ
jgi:hypothetical protein